MKHTFIPKGVCSSQIDFEVEDGVILGITFKGGCNGNLQGLSRLAEGKTVEELLGALSGIKCGNKSTSCPDQLAKALRMSLEEDKVTV